MRLNPFNTSNIRVRQGGGGGFPGGGGGKLGCGSIVIAILAALIFGVDPAQMLGTIEQSQQQSGGPVAGSQSETDICTQNAYAAEGCAALDSLNTTWAPLFQQAGITFRDPLLTYYTGGTNSGCGSAQSAMGPFYCPGDEGIYIDTAFFQQMEQQMGAGGDFARVYVMAHEYGHHIQKLTGVAGQIRSAQQQNPRAANQLQVRMELQADCYAGVWAGLNRNLIERGDIEEGMRAANAIGDDTLTGGRANPESFTHGSSAQRMQALRDGIQAADDTVCDRYVQMR
ncbi:neutral zinc metallopeptidase [Altererythrobacter aquiaggeris]|uniref:KPN_02809 family neutral zinc metallopeptidase n=1 Tax=Aestuarierythrobacter aquiaggeris TaxID=1898396 RepID=UPI0030160B92